MGANYIKTKIKTKSKKDSIEYKDGIYIIHTKEPPRDNRANSAVIDLLSEYLNIPKSNIYIKHGIKGKTKIIGIVDDKQD